MTKTLKDHEQDLASKVAAMSEKHEGAQLVLLMASTFQKKLMERTDLSNPAHGMLIALADLIGAAVETADEFLKLDEAPQAAEAADDPIASIDLSIYETYPLARTTAGFRVLREELEHCRNVGKHMHIAIPADKARPYDLNTEWRDSASLITVVDHDGKIISILKNRLGRTS